MSRALTEAEIRKIIRSHPDAFGAIVRLNGGPHGDVAHRITNIIMAHPEIADSIAITGLNLDPANVKIGPIMRWLAAAHIVSLTQAAHAPEALVALFYAEFARLAVDGDELDSSLLKFFGEGGRA